jgi:hypothetical protein
MQLGKIMLATYESLVSHKRSYCEVGSIEQADATPLVPEHQLLTWTKKIILKIKVNIKVWTGISKSVGLQ